MVFNIDLMTSCLGSDPTAPAIPHILTTSFPSSNPMHGLLILYCMFFAQMEILYLVIDMNETQYLINVMMESVRICRSCVYDCLEAVSGAALRSFLSQVLRELDGIETELTAKAMGLEVYFDALPPLSYYFTKLRNRLILHFKKTDSAVAERMICCCTTCSIRITRAKNADNLSESTADLIFERLHGCLNATVRNCRNYL